MIEPSGIQPWFFQIEPFQGESLSHFLGRFRRENGLTPNGLGKISGLGGAISRWEKLRFNPYPTRQQFEKLSDKTAVAVECLWEMMPSSRVEIKLEPIRLCAACYAEVPCHQIRWQLKETQGCNVHHLRLLSECPTCKARFQHPALWRDGWCHRCFTLFSNMHSFQKGYSIASIEED